MLRARRGILGLTNLVYFGEHYPDVFRRLVSAQGKRDYPLACAGINVTSMLLELLRIEPNSSPEQARRRGAHARRRARAHCSGAAWR